MAQRETYLRACLKKGKLEVVAGLQVLEGDNLHLLKRRLNLLMEIGTSYLLPTDDELKVAELVEYRIKDGFPGRAYFLEVDIEGDGLNWIQLFQPYGVPMEDPLVGTPFQPSPYR